MWTYNHTDELYHHGIKGMKWGIRRFRKKDGSLTSAGKKRYQIKGDGKIKQYVDKKTNVRRTRLVNNYRKSGKSEAEAQAAAEKRLKIEKAIAITAGLTVTACAAYYAKNKWTNTYCDQILKSGTTFHNLDSKANPRPGEHLYVNYRKDDTDYFRGHFAVNKMRQTGHVFNHEITATGDIKIPSLNTRKNTFKQLYDSDPEFRKAFSEHSRLKPNASAKEVYKNMWMKMGDKDNPEFNTAKRKYFEALRQKGYEAIVDEWDTRPTVFRSEAPLILLNTSSKSLGEMTIRELQTSDIFTAQANSKSWIVKRDLKNSVALGFHNNHFEESARQLSKYAAKSERNSKRVERVVSALKDHEDQEWAKKTVDDYLKGRKGSSIARAGKYMERNANMKVSEAIKKSKDVDAKLATAGFVAATAAAYAPSLAVDYAINQMKINRYVSKHPNTKLSDAEILKRIG